MAAVAFDSLGYANQLEAAGMSREQAEVVAKGLTNTTALAFPGKGPANFPETARSFDQIT